MTYIIIAIILVQVFSLFSYHMYSHSTYSEYGIRLVKQYKTKPVLVISLGKRIVRVE